MICTIVVIKVIYVRIKALQGGYEGIFSVEMISRDCLNIGWFSTVIIIYYVTFWLIFRNRILGAYRYNMLGYLIFIFAFIIACKMLGLTSTWYGKSFAFPMGLVWAHYRKEIDRIIYKKYRLFMLTCVVMLIVCNGLIMFRERGFIKIAGPGVMAGFLLGILFPIFWNLLMIKLDFRGKVWHWLGIISFELYLIECLSHPTARLLADMVAPNYVEVYALLALAIGVAYSSGVYHISSMLGRLLLGE